MTTFTTDTLYLRREIQGSKIGDDLVIFDDRVGRYFATGPVGAEIWEMLSKPTSPEILYVNLMALYSIEEDKCRSEIRDFILKLLEADLVVRADP